jgi:hypothetical protein
MIGCSAAAFNYFFHLYPMTADPDRFRKAIEAFDAYHRLDPNTEKAEGGELVARELLYARRMTDRLVKFAPDASETVKLAARCQHIGRWEIPRERYPMDKKGYLLWRNQEKFHHAEIAGRILADCGYEKHTIEGVNALLLKKELFTNAETQLLEDVICLVFIEYYLEDFRAKHEEEKVIDILQKTMRKMSAAGKQAVETLNISPETRSLLQRASAPQV